MKCAFCSNRATESITEAKTRKEVLICSTCDNKINWKPSLSFGEKRKLLKLFLGEEVFKAVVSTLAPKQLNHYIDENLDTLLKIEVNE